MVISYVFLQMYTDQQPYQEFSIIQSIGYNLMIVDIQLKNNS